MSTAMQDPTVRIEDYAFLLGAISNGDPAAMDTAIRIAGAALDHWPDKAMQAVWDAALTLHRQGAHVHLEALFSELSRNGQLGAVGGATALAELIGHSSTSANVEYFAEQVRADWLCRRRVELHHQAALAAADGNLGAYAIYLGQLAALDDVVGGLTYATWGDDWITEAEKPLPWLIPDWLLRETVTVCAAAGGTGKSFLALALAVSAATGTDLFKGFSPIERTPVLFIDFENTDRTVKRRVNGLRRRYALDVDHMTASMRDWFHLVQQRGSFIEPGPGGRGWVETALFRQLLAEARRIKPGLIVVDHLRRAGGSAPGNETEAMGAVIERCDILARESGAAVLVLAHANKAARTQDANAGNVRGSGAIVDEARCAWEMRSDDKNGLITLQRVKVNEAPKGEALFFRMAPLADHGVAIELADAPPMQQGKTGTPAANSDMAAIMLRNLARFNVSVRGVKGDADADTAKGEEPGQSQLFREAVEAELGKRVQRSIFESCLRGLLDSGKAVQTPEGSKGKLILSPAPEYAGGDIFDACRDGGIRRDDGGISRQAQAVCRDAPPIGDIPPYRQDISPAGGQRPIPPYHGESEQETNVVKFERPASLSTPAPTSGPLFEEPYSEQEDEPALF